MSAKESPVNPAGESGEDRVVVTITDPLAIRALAHKVRLEVIDEFFSSKRAHTATELAGRFGLTPSAMSYHLRALEKWGYVVRVESTGDARERYWRAAGDTLNVGGLAMASELISSSFIDVTLGTARDRVVRALGSAEATEGENKAAFLVENSKYLLTKKQSEDFVAEFEALSKRYRQLSDDAEDRVGTGGSVPSGSRHMHATMLFVPEVPPEKE
jgi:DNA-binding transcriptional ArsR family regulator